MKAISLLHRLRFIALASLTAGIAVQGLRAQTTARHDASGNMTLLSAVGVSAPSIVSGPVSLILAPGAEGSMSVIASGGPPYTFQWFRNGVPLAGSASDTILFTNMSGSLAGDYKVAVANGSGSVTSSIARLDIDTDRDGLGDGWEIQYFGSITNQNSKTDRDGDGVVDGLEFGDGTNPTNRNLFLPRLTLASAGGVILAEPLREAYQSNELVTLTAVPDPGLSFIGWSGDLQGTVNPATLRMTAHRQVQASFGLPLALAINTTNLVTTGGRGGWIGQTNSSRDGIAAAVAPPLAGTGDPYLEVSVNAARDGVASFWWRIDGEKDDTLRVLVDNAQEFAATRILIGTTDWQMKTIFLPAGMHKVRWVYTRYGGGWTEKPGGVKPLGTAYIDQFTVAEYANPLADADGNGLPDLWEYRYFDGMGNDRNADPDGDGVATRIELADGTDPNNKSSVIPRLAYQVEGRGAAVASPSADVYAYGQWVTNTAVPDPGWHFVAWVGPFDNNYFFKRVNTNNPSRDRLYQSKTFKAVFGLPPGLAADAPSLSWSTSAGLPWFGQTLITHDGTNAAQSMVVEDDYGSEKSDSWLETTVSGPGSLSFFWKVSSATNADYLSFLVNGTAIGSGLSGNVDWQPVTIELPEGPQTLRWSFQRNYGYDTNALHAAWLDAVRFTSGPSKPVFFDAPASLLGFVSSNVTFRAAARGTPPILYQVWANGVALTTPSTNNLITVANAGLAMTGAWIIRAQNASGSTDSAPIPAIIYPAAPNDLFGKAASLSGAAPVFNGYTFGAGKETGEPSHSSYSPHASTWHRWTAPADGVVRVTVTATNVPRNLILAVYRGSSLKTLTSVVEDDAYSEETNGVTAASVSVQWRAAAGTSYLLAVDTGDGAGVFYRLVFEQRQPPANDAFANRIPILGSFARIEGDNSTATVEPDEPPILSIPPFYTVYANNTLWWTWTAPVSGRLVISPLSDDISPLFSIFTGNSLATLQRLTNAMAGGVTVNVTQGVPYAISVDSEQGQGGHFTFILTVDTTTLSVARPSGNDPGAIEVTGPPNRQVVVQFSPNLQDWYFWSSNTVSSAGVLQISLEPPQYLDQTLKDEEYGGEYISIPPSRKRFFRVIMP